MRSGGVSQIVRMRSGGVSPKVRRATPAKHLPISFSRICETPPDLVYSSGLLSFNRVRKRYGTLLAVDDLTLEIRPGEIFGLLGPNGAGKSTTVNLAVGLLSPEDGTVTIGNGASPAQASVRRRIGVAPQALAVYDQLTGRENLEFFGRIYGLNRSTLGARVEVGAGVRPARGPGSGSRRGLLGRHEAPLEPCCGAGSRP